MLDLCDISGVNIQILYNIVNKYNLVCKLTNIHTDAVTTHKNTLASMYTSRPRVNIRVSSFTVQWLNNHSEVSSGK